MTNLFRFYLEREKEIGSYSLDKLTFFVPNHFVGKKVIKNQLEMKKKRLLRRMK